MTLKTNDHEIERHRAISPDRRRLSGVRLTLALGVITTACTIAPVTERPGAAAPVSTMPPSGYGSLLQSEVSMSLGSRDLEIMVTPLDESVIRVTAPDTEERLRGIAAANRSALPDSARLFLVSFFTAQVDVAFVPEEIQLIAQGLRVLPTGIAPVTPGWRQRRVLQRQTELAVYAFPPDVDLESELVLVYGFDQTSAWSGILPRIQSERARARARATVGN
ncbi:MAG: hypothetical protein OXU33_03145 [Gemmatimonadota bacterium]|nr:hypothetical protein [Gemmatimonadota bacterium]MDE3005120.1 hypothetical protein [Gemmatimonadota bacterium]MDE3013045.1 hypothetical protein [Gemmatimonadota bacterium]